MLLDIETAPNLATVWGLFKQNIGINQLIESSYVLCWAAKWYGEDAVYFDSIHRSRPKAMVQRIHKMLDEADAVIHYNGKKFDIPTLNKEFLQFGIRPPSPYKQIDLLTTTRNQFRFPSNKLDYVAQRLGLGKKVAHEGHELWLKCMNKDAEAWEKMEEYNTNDVYLLEDLYEKLKPWIKSHPNHSVFTETCVCPNCASTRYQKRGFTFSLAGKYQRFQCRDCGTWFRSVKNVADRSKFVTSGV